MKLIAALMILLGIATLASMFCYAAFDLAWWTPIGTDGEGRVLTLMVLHFFGLFAGVSGAIEVDRREFVDIMKRIRQNWPRDHAGRWLL